MKKISQIIFIIFSIVLLTYMVIPGTVSVEDMPDLPNSARSTLSGDNWQVANLKAYFSNNFRNFVTSYYYDSYMKQNNIPFKPLKLNYPPEYAYTAIKDQTRSTYLEEYTYPLRDTVYVNGMEPFLEDGEPRYAGAVKFIEGDTEYLTKTTLRYYPSSLYTRVFVWAGIVASVYLLYSTGRRVFLNV